MSEGPAKVSTSLEVRLGQLRIRWSPASDVDKMPVELVDESNDRVITYTDLAGVEELAAELSRFVVHHQAITGTPDGLPESA